MVLPFFSAEMLLWNCGSGRDEEPAEILRLIQIRIDADDGKNLTGLSIRKPQSRSTAGPFASANRCADYEREAVRFQKFAIATAHRRLHLPIRTFLLASVGHFEIWSAVD